MGLPVNLPSEQEFSQFQKLIHQQLGIDLTPQKRAMLGHRLVKRVDALGLSGFGAYYQYIRQLENKSELDTALELITTNETFFFREEKHFQYLKDEILPAVRLSRPFDVWSAACSTGEEPYSIAMLLDHQRKGPWSVLATDVNNRVVEKARKGIYLDDRTDLIPEIYRRRYCRMGVGEFDGYLRIEPKIRSKIDYRTLNLNQNFKNIGPFDLVFLRNVMIYFNEEVKTNILKQVSKVLKPDGLLFISHSESLHGLTDEFTPVQPAIYRLKPR